MAVESISWPLQKMVPDSRIQPTTSSDATSDWRSGPGLQIWKTSFKPHCCFSGWLWKSFSLRKSHCITLILRKLKSHSDLWQRAWCMLGKPNDMHFTFSPFGKIYIIMLLLQFIVGHVCNSHSKCFHFPGMDCTRCTRGYGEANLQEVIIIEGTVENLKSELIKNPERCNVCSSNSFVHDVIKASTTETLDDNFIDLSNLSWLTLLRVSQVLKSVRHNKYFSIE